VTVVSNMWCRDGNCKDRASVMRFRIYWRRLVPYLSRGKCVQVYYSAETRSKSTTTPKVHKIGRSP
jgi:hypothetical protein